MVSREQVINCLSNFYSYTHQVDLIRTYCHEKGKEDLEIEVFLQAVRDKSSQSGVDLFSQLVHYIIDIKLREFNIVRVFNKEGNLIFIF